MHFHTWKSLLQELDAHPCTDEQPHDNTQVSILNTAWFHTSLLAVICAVLMQIQQISPSLLYKRHSCLPILITLESIFQS